MQYSIVVNGVGGSFMHGYVSWDEYVILKNTFEHEGVDLEEDGIETQHLIEIISHITDSHIGPDGLDQYWKYFGAYPDNSTIKVMDDTGVVVYETLITNHKNIDHNGHLTYKASIYPHLEIASDYGFSNYDESDEISKSEFIHELICDGAIESEHDYITANDAKINVATYCEEIGSFHNCDLVTDVFDPELLQIMMFRTPSGELITWGIEYNGRALKDNGGYVYTKYSESYFIV